MAGLMPSAEMRGQFAAIAQLRWHLFRNILRSRRGKAELVSRIILALVFCFFGLGGSVGLGFAAGYFVSEGKGEWLAILLWPVFLFWQCFPIMASAFTENLESSHLLRFPLSYRSYFLVRIVYGLFDPATSVGSLWLLGILLGITVASPLLFLPAVIVLLVFAAVNVLLTRMIFSWVERWLAQRRTREIFGLLLFLFIIGVQFIGPATEHFAGKRKPGPGVVTAVGRITVYQRVLPPGVAAQAIASVSQGRFPIALAWMAALCGYGVALIGLLHFRLYAQFLGESLSEVEASRVSPAERQPLRLGWEIPRISGPVAAIFEKELRILSRSGPMLLTLVMPVVAMFILRIGRWHIGNTDFQSIMLGPSDFGFSVGAIYSLLMLTNLVYNSFGADGNGVQFFLLAPVPFREIILGKNLVHATFLATDVVLVWLAVHFVYGSPVPAMTVATLAGLLFAAPINFAAGNLLSIYSPKRVDYGTFGRQKASQLTVLASLGVQLSIFVVGGATVFLARLYGTLWLATPVFLLLAVFAIAGYLLVLKRVDKIALDRRETLVSELGKT
jgi:ABC-2 type transport system permease protein